MRAVLSACAFDAGVSGVGKKRNQRESLIIKESRWFQEGWQMGLEPTTFRTTI